VLSNVKAHMFKVSSILDVANLKLYITQLIDAWSGMQQHFIDEAINHGVELLCACDNC